MASARPQPAISASTRATTTKSGSPWLSLPALILPQNSSTSARGWRSERRNEFVLGKSLSSIVTPAAPHLLELAHQPPHVVEVAVAGVAVHEDRDRPGGVGHEADVLHHLRPRELVVVAHAEGRRH